MYLLKGTERDVIFSGDAAKNRAELTCGRADMSYDASVSGKSIAAIREVWGRRPGSLLVPGHDMPMVLRDGRIAYVGKREAAINSWFGDDLETTTTIELVVG